MAGFNVVPEQAQGNTGGVSADASPAAPPPAPFNVVGDDKPQGFNVVDGENASPLSVPKDSGSPVKRTPEADSEGLIEGSKALWHRVESPVAKTLKLLNTPLNIAAGTTARVVGSVDPNLKPDLASKGTPVAGIAPDITFYDLTTHYGDAALSAMGLDSQSVLDRQLKRPKGEVMSSDEAEVFARGQALYKGIESIAGVASDLVLDPLRWLSFGQRTAAAEKAYKAGDIENAGARSVVALKNGLPLSSGETFAELPAKAVTDAVPESIKNMSSAAYELTAGKGVQLFRDVFDYRTGIPEIDVGHTIRTAKLRGDASQLANDILGPMKKMGITTPEFDTMAKVMEDTPNLAPKVPVEDVGGLADDELSAQVLKRVQSVAGDVPAPRQQQLADAVMILKRADADGIEKRFAAGLLNEDQMKTWMRDNYLVHATTPEAKAFIQKRNLQGISDPSVLDADAISALEKDANQVARKSAINTFDPSNMKRKVSGTVFEANDYMKEALGVDFNFFETNPARATFWKQLKTSKAIRDTEFARSFLPYGEEVGVGARPSKGFSLLDSRFKGQMVNLNGQQYDLGMMAFPSKVAQKMSYFLLPKEVGSFSKAVDAYNSVFRRVTLFNLGHTIQMWGDNFFKNYVQGVKVADYSDAMKILGDVTNTYLKPMAGLEKDAFLQGIMKEAKAFGLATGGEFKEGIGNLVELGKKINKDSYFASGQPARFGVDGIKEMVGSMRAAGEKGDTYTRLAMYINRRRQGYAPEMALNEVEKFLFDYSKTSQGTDYLRRFWNPFIQHAVKTLQITPEMLGRNAAAYNFFVNNMLRDVEKSFHDPVSASILSQYIPGYRAFQDPAIGPVFSGNSLFATIMGGPKNQTSVPHYLTLFKAPIGPDIMNRFMAWDSNVMKSGMGGGPIPLAVSALISGKDPFTQKNLDIDPNQPDPEWRLTKAAHQLLNMGGMMGLPKILKQALGIGDPKYYDPVSLTLLQGQFGQFVTFQNMDKEFMIRQMAFKKAEETIQSQLRSKLINETQGRDIEQYLSGQPGLVRKGARFVVSGTPSSEEIFSKFLDEKTDMQKMSLARSLINNQPSVADYVRMLKAIETSAEATRNTYITGAQRRLQLQKEMRTPVQQGPAPTASPQASASPGFNVVGQ